MNMCVKEGERVGDGTCEYVCEGGRREAGEYKGMRLGPEHLSISLTPEERVHSVG